jgi:hypothetical protein
MGKCKYCGINSGLFKSYHKECLDKHQNGRNEIISVTEKAIMETSDFVGLNSAVSNIGKDCHIYGNDIISLMVNGFDKSVERVLEDGILTIEEEDKISKFNKHFDFSYEDMNKNGYYDKFTKSALLRVILNGQIPESKIKVNGTLPFVLEKGEIIIWIYTNTQLLEQRTKTHYQGGSQGISVKIAKGLYYRTSAFKGFPIKTTEMQHIANGITCITEKNVYFASTIKNFKIPYKKLLTIDPYEDGIGLQKDGSTAKPIILKGIDGWFTYNVISNLSQK